MNYEMKAERIEIEKNEYEQSLKIFRDYSNTIYTAFDDGKSEGKIEGEIEGKIEVIKQGRKMGLSNIELATLTGLTIEEIDKL